MADGAMPGPELAARLAAVPGAEQVEARRDGLWVAAPHLDVQEMAHAMNALGCRLVTITGLARDRGETEIIYHFVRSGEVINFTTSTHNGAIPSVTPVLRPASWAEREIHDFFAVDFVGHPNLAPLLRPASLNEGFFRDPEPHKAES